MPEVPEPEAAQEIFWPCQRAKAKWRSFMRTPTRRTRRVIRRKGKAKGKGRLFSRKGKGKQSIQQFLLESEEDPASIFFGGGKGKKGRSGKSSGRGFGRRNGNPTGPDGKKMACF